MWKNPLQLDLILSIHPEIMSFFWMFLATCVFASIGVEAKPKVYHPQIYYLTLPDLEEGEIDYVNGMNHKPGRAVQCGTFLSELADNHKIFIVYNPTSGLFGDLKKSYHELFKCKISKPVVLLHQKWNHFFQEHPDVNQKLLQFCHSEGAIQVRNALLFYPPQLRKRIIVVAIAPAAYISQEICCQAFHYVSRRDIVPFFDRQGRARCADSIVTLTPHRDAHFFDHHFLSPTYHPAITYHLQEYIRTHGSSISRMPPP